MYVVDRLRIPVDADRDSAVMPTGIPEDADRPFVVVARQLINVSCHPHKSFRGASKSRNVGAKKAQIVP